MADYLSILKKTIDGLPNNTIEIRQAVYRKARTTIEAQLRGIDPSLSDDVIGAQLQSLEEAVLIAETDYAAAAMQLDDEVAIEIEEPEPEPGALNDALEIDESDPEDIVAPPDGAVPSGGEIGSEPPAAKDEGLDILETRPGSRKIRRYLILVVLLLMFAGAGAGLWFNRDSLEPMVMSWISDSQTGSETGMGDPSASQDGQISDEDTVAEVKKDDVKLSGEPDKFPQEEVPIANLEPTDEPITLVEPGSASADPVVGGEDREDQPVQEVTDIDTSTQFQTPSNDPIPIGEVAYLYEEGDAGAGATRANASVAWSTKMESLSQGLPEEPVVVASMDVPEKALSMEMALKRNVDVSISASHIIEIRFQVPEGFSGAGIDNISRFVLKSTEEARGEPLVAVPVKVSEGFFLVAMDNLQQAVDVNTQLLLESSWIDMPISYSTGKRALVTLAKGDTGDQVLKDAFADWQNR